MVAALCGGCGTFTNQMTESADSIPQTKLTISVGQPFDETMNLLTEAGAKDITHAISLIDYGPGELRWFGLRDGRRLAVRVVEEGESKQLVVDNLMLGDKNTNHNKERGLSKYREMTRLELP